MTKSLEKANLNGLLSDNRMITKKLCSLIDEWCTKKPWSSLCLFTNRQSRISKILDHMNGGSLAGTIRSMLGSDSVKMKLRKCTSMEKLRPEEFYRLCIWSHFEDHSTMVEFFKFVARVNTDKELIAYLVECHEGAFKEAFAKQNFRVLTRSFGFSQIQIWSKWIADVVLICALERNYSWSLSTAKRLVKGGFVDHAGMIVLFCLYEDTGQTLSRLESSQSSLISYIDNYGAKEPHLPKIDSVISGLPSFSQFPENILMCGPLSSQLRAVHKCFGMARISYLSLLRQMETSQRQLRIEIQDKKQILEWADSVYEKRVYVLIEKFQKHGFLHNKLCINKILKLAEPTIFEHIPSVALDRMYLSASNSFLDKETEDDVPAEAQRKRARVE